jgi:hypothetical protein
MLVHYDYAKEFEQQLKRFGVQTDVYFDPYDGATLKDPKHTGLSASERSGPAYMYQCNRMERALKYIRTPVRYAVAHYFYSMNWISKATLNEALSFSLYSVKLA